MNKSDIIINEEFNYYIYQYYAKKITLSELEYITTKLIKKLNKKNVKPDKTN